MATLVVDWGFVPWYVHCVALSRLICCLQAFKNLETNDASPTPGGAAHISWLKVGYCLSMYVPATASPLMIALFRFSVSP